MSILDPGHTWNEIKDALEKLSSLVPPGEILELLVFGGSTVLYWGMEGRLSRDVDVQQSGSSPFLLALAPASNGLIRHRDSEGPDPKGPYVEIAPPEADSYLPRFSVYERVTIAENVILKLPAPAEIAAPNLLLRTGLIALRICKISSSFRKNLGAGARRFCKSFSPLNAKSIGEARSWCGISLNA